MWAFHCHVSKKKPKKPLQQKSTKLKKDNVQTSKTKAQPLNKSHLQTLKVMCCLTFFPPNGKHESTIHIYVGNFCTRLNLILFKFCAITSVMLSQK